MLKLEVLQLKISAALLSFPAYQISKLNEHRAVTSSHMRSDVTGLGLVVHVEPVVSSQVRWNSKHVPVDESSSGLRLVSIIGQTLPVTIMIIVILVNNCCREIQFLYTS